MIDKMLKITTMSHSVEEPPGGGFSARDSQLHMNW